MVRNYQGHVMSAEPTRERVAAYEKALGCWTLTPTEFRRRICFRHQKDEWTDLGCPVAVAAARVEAERVAEVEAEVEQLRAVVSPRKAAAMASLVRSYSRLTEIERDDARKDRDALRAVVEQVRALAESHKFGPNKSYERGISPRNVLALLPEATS